MKKTFTVILTVYVTITTVAAILFGWLYFAGLKNEGVSFNAKALVDRVYNDLGFNNSTSSSSTSADAFQYDDFEGDDLVDAVGMDLVSSQKLHLGIVKYALGALPSNFDQSAIYTSQVTYKDNSYGYDNYYKFTFFCKLTITSDTVFTTVSANVQQSSTQNFPEKEVKPTEFETGYIKVKQTSELGWELDTYTCYNAGPEDVGVTSGEGYIKAFGHFTAGADEDGKLYQIGCKNFTYKNPTTPVTEPKVEGQTKLSEFVFVDANTKTKKKIKIDERATLGGDPSLDAEKVEFAETQSKEILSAVAVMPNFNEQSETIEKDFAKNIIVNCWIRDGVDFEIIE